MIAYAEQEFYWHGKDEGSKVSRIVLQTQAAKQSKKAQAAIDAMIVLDSRLQYIWLMFVDLFNATNGNITYSEIKAYSEWSGKLSEFEVKSIMRINSAKRNSNG